MAAHTTLSASACQLAKLVVLLCPLLAGCTQDWHGHASTGIAVTACYSCHLLLHTSIGLLCSFVQRLAHSKLQLVPSSSGSNAAIQCCGLQPLKSWTNYAQIVTELLIHLDSTLVSALCHACSLYRLCQACHMTLRIFSASGGLMTTVMRPALSHIVVALLR